MTEQENMQELLTFFKALADENRLKIVGLLAQKPHSVENLAQGLGLSVSTTSHHLSRLADAGLVSAKVDGHFYIYSLQTAVLKNMSEHLLKDENLPKLSEGLGEDVFDQKVLASFTDKDGRITAFPAQEKKFLVLLKYVLSAFEPGVRYSEKQVNETLLKFNKDTASLRRAFIEYKLMDREGGGGAYWRTDKKDGKVSRIEK
jgi:predicted transcriptional regulator